MERIPTNKKEEDKNRSRIPKYVGIRERRRRIGHVRKKERKNVNCNSSLKDVVLYAYHKIFNKK